MGNRRVVIVGGVAAGMSTATRLRRNDEALEIVVLERGDHVSFANCGLPYHVGGVIPERDRLLLQTPAALQSRFNLDVRVGHEVLAVDRAVREVVVRRVDSGNVVREPYDVLVIATGAHPVRPDVPGAEHLLTLRDVADLDQIMAVLDGGSVDGGSVDGGSVDGGSVGGGSGEVTGRPAGGASAAAILGGGFIGLELAENLVKRGLAVTVVEASEQVLGPLDPEMAGPVTDHLKAAGVRVLTRARAVRVEPDAVVLDDGRRVSAGLLVAAIGVRPESSLAAAAGLELDSRGAILVDAQQRTSDPAIFAVGDVASKPDAVGGGPAFVPLAQTANRHGRVVADVVTGRPVRSRPVLGTAIVGLFGLVAATVGWNEKRLRAAGRTVANGELRVVHTHPSHHAGYYPGARPMALKLLVDARTDAILGAQAVGFDGVDKRIDVIATAMRAGLSASDLADLELAYAPQFGSAKDPVNLIGMVADNVATGERTIQWYDVASAIEDGATLVDVRSRAEFAAGAIPEAMNLPLDELRERAGEIPSGRVIVACAVGQRGHTAGRLLTHLGRDVANLDGGYRTWLAAQGVTSPAESGLAPAL